MSPCRYHWYQKNVVARVAQAARVCWTVDHVTVCNELELESAVSSFFGSSSAWSCSTMMWRKTLRRCPLLLALRQVSGVKMRSRLAWNSKTRYLQAQPATPRARWHPRLRAEDVLCKKGFLSVGNLTDTAIGLAVDEKQLISWARTNQPKK